VKRIAGGFGVVLFALVAWMVYANVVSPDAEVIAKAEQLARDKLGCGSECMRTRAEGTSRVIDKQYSFTFDKGGPIGVVCRRPYIAFGTFACSLK
jgi:hypothetical protein